jgi:8-oxo-dGTP pyrophosphatase MutT (NUDIX family)
MMNGMPSEHSDAIERMNRFVQRMNEVDRKLTAPYVAPKDAATLILVDRSARRPKVLLGKRHARHKFMPGKFVFPGGRVDPGDKRMPVARPLNPDAQANLMKRLARASPAKAHGFALAAIRETFEETGLLIGVPVAEVPAVPKGPWAAFAQARILPDLGDLHFIGRAITPPGRPRRFDARFFTLDASAIAHRIEGVTGPDAELVELVWMPLTEAKELDMPAVTGVMLEELDARIADGFGHDLPVPFYRMPRGRFMRELL